MKWLGMQPVEGVRPNSWNVNTLPEEEYAKLKEAMKASGPEGTEPITVRKVEDGAWEIVDGEQRWKIAKQLGWKAIPAVEIDVDRRKAKYLCLSYNAVRGTVNFAKLSELAAADPEMYEAAVKVFGKEEAEKLVESAKKLTAEAKKALDEAVKAGAKVSADVVQIVASAPTKELQKYAAEAAETGKHAVEVFVQSTVEQYTKPKEEAAAEAKPKAEKKKEYTIGGRAYEIVRIVQIDKPGEYAIYYDPENRNVGMKEHKLEHDIFEETPHEPKLFSFTFKCGKCGTVYEVRIDALTGEFEVKQKQ